MRNIKDKLNSVTLYTLMTICNTNKDYKAAIIFDTPLSLRDFYREWVDNHSIQYIHGVKQIESSLNGAIIQYYNGSKIELLLKRSKMRGRIFHHVLYESTIDAIADLRVIPYHDKPLIYASSSLSSDGKFMQMYSILYPYVTTYKINDDVYTKMSNESTDDGFPENTVDLDKLKSTVSTEDNESIDEFINKFKIIK